MTTTANIRLRKDLSTGHGCWPPTVPKVASPNVYINGIAEVRMGDAYVPHCCPKKGCHSGKALARTIVTNTNSRKTHTNAAPISCKDRASHGSPDVFSG